MIPRKPRILALVAAVALGLCSCTSPEERRAAHLARGEQHEARGERPAAILEYLSALEIEPEDAELNERLGELLTRQGALDNAARHYREAHRIDPERVSAAMREAQLVAFRDRARADELLEAALADTSDAPIVQRTVSELALIDGRTAEALTAAMRAIELDRDDAESWIQLGRAYQGRLRQLQMVKERGDDALFLSAIRAFERADRLMKGDVGVRLERAQVFSAWPGHGNQAVGAYLKALSLARRRNNPENLAISAHALNDFARAAGSDALRLRALREIVNVDASDLSSWQQLARLSGRTGTGEPERVYRELLARRPGDAGAHRLYVSYLLAEDRPKDAVAHLEGALAQGLDAPLLWDDLIRIRLQRGQLAQAQEHFARLSDTAPNHAITRRAEARLMIAQGRNGKAARLLEPLLAGEGGGEALRLLAVAERRRGKLTQARDSLDRALTRTSGFSAPMHHLAARIRHDMADWQGCLDALSELARHGQSLSPEERWMQARALYQTGKDEQGRQALEALLLEPGGLTLGAVEYARREGSRAPDRAHAQLETAAAAEPDSFPVLEALVELEVARGLVSDALGRLDAEVAAGRGGPRLLLLRAEILTGQGDLARAESDALRAFEAAPSLAQAADLLLRIYTAQGTLDEARRSFEEAAAAGVLYSGARLLLGRLYALQGDAARARSTFEQGLEERPGLQEARMELAMLLARRGEELPRALQLAREAENALERSPRAAHAVGYVHYRRGQHKAALAQFERALELDAAPGSALTPTVHYHQGLTLQALDRTEQAASAFESALELDASFPDADDARRRLAAVR